MDLLIVADEADVLAAMVAAFARQRGVEAILLAHDRAAMLFTVASKGEAPVEPELPILLRPRLRPADASSADSRFLAGERHALLWAAAGLTRAPVVNRPGRHGFEGLWAPSGALLELRSGLPVHAEIHARPDSPRRPPDARPWAAEGRGGRARRWLSARRPGEAFRARAVLQEESYEQVVVLSRRAWRTSTVDLRGRRLRARSIEVARRLGLTFAVVTWGLDRSLERDRLARVDPYPAAEQVLPVWKEAGPALLEALSC